MAATGPEGNRGQRSPPGAAFVVAMLIPGPGDRAPMTRLTAGRPACCPEPPARPGTTAGGPHRAAAAALAAARTPGQKPHNDDDDRRDQPGDQERPERCGDPVDSRDRQPDGQD